MTNPRQVNWGNAALLGFVLCVIALLISHALCGGLNG